jgi:pSer/pThr/pTyr-binding forkhead associated (FHA) protein
LPTICGVIFRLSPLEDAATSRFKKMPRVTITAPDKNAQPYRFQLDREIVTIGRGGENDIVVDSGSVSTSHAEMRRVRGGYELADIGSTNGLKGDGARYESVPLHQGSSVQIGDVTFDFSLAEDELVLLAGEAKQFAAPSLPAASFTPAALPQAQPQARPVPRREVIVMNERKSGGFFMTLVLLIFALAAFGVGASVRHQKDTGGSLFERVKAKFLVEKKAPAPSAVAAPAAETPAPETPPATPAQ